MSTATTVPETYDLQGDDALETVRRTGPAVLLRDSFARMRWADGFSHSRALAFQLVLTLIPGTIVTVAIAAELHWESLSEAIVRTTRNIAPGPSSDVFAQAFEQGARRGTGHWAALIGGSMALLVAGTTAFGQIERAANRIYGVEADRPTRQKYSVAFGLLASAGLLAVLYFLVIGLGGSWGGDADSSTLGSIWSIARWPVAAGVLVVAFAMVFKASPRRIQPGLSWLMVGAAVAVGCSVLVSGLLNLYMSSSSTFGSTYGPLTGFIAVLLWTYLSSIALLFGVAVSAQLEAVRAGVGEPRSAEKVDSSEPDSVTIPYGSALR